MTDTATGFDRRPDRYSGQERETIDRIRDELGDELFIGFCLGTAMKYWDRAGRKGPKDEDLEKADWYAMMAKHVAEPDLHRDPRHKRDDFVPYERPNV
jgi:hypothetical protein